jgi:hypothetical protein
MDVCSFGILISFCSHRAPFLGPGDDLVRGGLDVLRQHLGRRVPARPPWRNDVNDSSSRKPAARMTSFTLRVMWVKSGIFVVAELLVFELVKDGSLNGDEIDTLISTAIASHQPAAEHARRAEWRKRAANAAAVFERKDIVMLMRLSSPGPGRDGGDLCAAGAGPDSSHQRNGDGQRSCCRSDRRQHS